MYEQDLPRPWIGYLLLAAVFVAGFIFGMGTI